MTDSPTIEAVILATAEIMAVPIKSIKGKSRLGHIVEARHVAMHAAKIFTGASDRQIAKAFNCASHGTILHAIKQNEHYMTCHYGKARKEAMAWLAEQFAKEAELPELRGQISLPFMVGQPTNIKTAHA